MTARNSPNMVVFLGNTGVRYARTRHNVAWMVAEHAPFADAPNWQRKFSALWTKTHVNGTQMILLKPQTMMNRSGESVQAAARFFRFTPREIVLVHDDVELPFGRVSLRLGGGLAGHNGLRSVAHCLATPDFWRLRIGVGRPERGDLHNYVLGRFTPEEEGALPAVLDTAAQRLVDAARQGLSREQE